MSATILRPTITIYDKTCLLRFFGDFVFLKKLAPYEFDVQTLNEQRIISLSIDGKHFDSSPMPRGDSPLLLYLEKIAMDYTDEIDARIAELHLKAS